MRRSIARGVHALALVSLILAGCASQTPLLQENAKNEAAPVAVKAGQFDTGKMWTFDFPPLDYFSKTYGFTPTREWFDKARLAALRLPGCTAAFVSEDGLVMTNHHCARGSLQRVQRQGENLVEIGFYAAVIDSERKAPVYVDQLVVIDDVTKEVQGAFDSGTTDSARTAIRTAKIAEIQKRYADKFRESTKDSMIFSVLPFYNGGRYSLYGYKRYIDVRLVFAPEERAAFFGGDPDNFTYPRYDFDCAFFRVYENGKPLKTDNFFRFSANGAAEGEPVFVIGNPGSTNRLQTYAQLETMRDYTLPFSLNASSSRLEAMTEYVAKHPEKNAEYLNQIFGVANGLKAGTGYLGGLKDPVLMAKKKDFEESFRTSVLGSSSLTAKYGNPWAEIAAAETKRRALLGESAALSQSATRSQYMNIASRLVDRAKNPAGTRPAPTAGEGRQGGPRGPIFPANFVPEIEIPLLVDQLTFMKTHLGDRNAAFNELLAGRTPQRAAEELAAATMVGSKEKVEALIAGKPEDILTSTDPLLAFAAASHRRGNDVRAELSAIAATQSRPSQLLGRAMYEVYGTSIPPDATFSLRIADGVVKGYDYNGTIAPPFTTFYGLYDRYYSFGKKDPWSISDRWLNPPPDFRMNTPMNFVSTNDIIGGNSGSSIINRNHEIVGLIFDGNIESLPGNVIYDETKNRAVSVHSSGLIEGVAKIYRAERLAKEMKAGKIVP